MTWLFLLNLLTPLGLCGIIFNKKILEREQITKSFKSAFSLILALLILTTGVLSGCDNKSDDTSATTTATTDEAVTTTEATTTASNTTTPTADSTTIEKGNEDMEMLCEKYLLESTNDKTDVTEKIEAMLNEHGACVLGSGVFYVSGIDMPEGSTLMGMGHASEIILKSSVRDGYAVKLGSECTIKNLAVLGGTDKISLPAEVGKRHGILFKGTANSTSDPQPHNSIVESCFVRSFEGGGITCEDTGYATSSSITASNCHITNCGAAINIPFFSEYHEFTNMLCVYNLYGCINNGGNNTFVNCGFNSNKVGFLIDNAQRQSKNNSHGSVIGCTFNHTDSNKGIGIKLLNAQYGYVFTGCQMWYSEIFVENSTNITFSNFNFGGEQKITVKGGKFVMFSNCVFFGDPTVNTDSNTKFINCFTSNGVVVE